MEYNITPLASLSQIKEPPSRLSGIPADLEEDLRAHGAKMIQQAGILLQQKQVAMSTAQVLFQRFWYVSSMEKYGIAEIGMGALYLASKLEECPLRMRDVINVYDVLIQHARHQTTSPDKPFHYEAMSYFSQTYYDMKDMLIVAEMQLLKRLGFDVHVVLPYGTLINYLRVLNLLDDSKACERSWGYLNDALQTPVYAMFPIPPIVCAAIFLTIRHLQLPLPSEPTSSIRWWELFDASFDDMWVISGIIMRLYRRRSEADQQRVVNMLRKEDVRKWLEHRK
ncbi:cyclin-like protein [Serendipita vermifera]|nr:cyclin-like protein [Serendipita vermifera]